MRSQSVRLSNDSAVQRASVDAHDRPRSVGANGGNHLSSGILANETEILRKVFGPDPD